jgi:SOS-response transcriptional repressor LexA
MRKNAAMETDRPEVARRRKNLAFIIDRYYGGSQALFVSQTGINQGELSALLKNKSFGEKKARKLENDVGIPLGLLDQKDLEAFPLPGPITKEMLANAPEFSKLFDSEKLSFTLHSSEPGIEPTEYAIDNVRKIPIISWVRAGNFSEILDIHSPGEADDWVVVMGKVLSKNAFALRVVGNSMSRDREPTFEEGDIIICDPNISANPGDFVIAKDVDLQAATFKQLSKDGSRWFLEPLNPKFPLIPIDKPELRIIAKVVQKVRISNF